LLGYTQFQSANCVEPAVFRFSVAFTLMNLIGCSRQERLPLWGQVLPEAVDRKAFE